MTSTITLTNGRQYRIHQTARRRQNNTFYPVFALVDDVEKCTPIKHCTLPQFLKELTAWKQANCTEHQFEVTVKNFHAPEKTIKLRHCFKCGMRKNHSFACTQCA